MNTGRSDALDEAVELLQDTVDRYTDRLGADAELTRSTAGNLVGALQELATRGEPERLEQARVIGERHLHGLDLIDLAQHTHLVISLVAALSNVYRDRTQSDSFANLDRAIVLGEAATAAAATVIGYFSITHLRCLSNLAMTYYSGIEGRHSDRAARAAQVLGEAMQIARRLSRDAPSVDLAVLVDQLGNVLADTATTAPEEQNVLALHRIAVAIKARALGPNDPSTLESRLNLCISLHQQANKRSASPYVVPGHLLRDPIDQWKQLIDDAHRSSGTYRTLRVARLALAMALLASDASGEVDIERALAEALAAGAQQEDFYEAPSARPIQVLLGVLLAERGHWTTAADFLSVGALSSRRFYRSAASIASRARALTEGSGIGLLAAYCLARSGRAGDAFELLEGARALWLKGTLALSSADVEALRATDAGLADEYERQVLQLSTLQSLESRTGEPLALMIEIRPVTPEEQDLLVRAVQCREALDCCLKRIRAIDGFEGFAREDDDLPPDDSLPQDRPTVFVGVSFWGGVALVRWPGGEVDALTDESYAHDDLVRFNEEGGYAAGQLGQEDVGLIDSLNRLPEVAPRLFDELSKRVRQRGFHGAVLLPCGGLAILPLNALGTTPIGDDVVVSYAPSLATLARTGQARRRRDRTLSPARYLGVSGGTAGPRFASVELLLARQAVGDGSGAVMTEPATEELLALLPDATIVHFASHGSYRRGRPDKASIVLGPGSRLSFADLVSHSGLTGTELVVASACQSAVHARLPEEYISFSSVFLFAGADTVLGSLWEVDDLSSALLVSKFFTGMAGGAGVATSLAEAQAWLRTATRGELLDHLGQPVEPVAGDVWAAARALLDDGPRDERPYTSPRHWAPFIVTGWPS